MNASEATGRRDFLLKEYDNLSSFYRYDLSTRFSVIRLYSGIVLARPATLPCFCSEFFPYPSF